MKQILQNLYWNPKLLERGLNRLYYRLSDGPFNSDGVDFIEQDWDNLVILDACRYDLFEEVSDLDGELRRVQSKASNTIQLLRSNIGGKTLTDTVYVTANPQYEKIADELDTKFHAVLNVWADRGWDERFNTVLPAVMTEEVRQVAEEYPHKRLLAHYNQPHIPFIGPTGRARFDMEELTEHPLPFWQQPMANVWDINDDEIWKAYRENLEEVLPHVEELLDVLQGRTVVTADHGNMIDERNFPLPI